MSFKLKNVKVKNLGPIEKLDWSLGDVNLVFGHNEKGKSYLVEFLVHTLFKSKTWSELRGQRGQGQIQLETASGEEKTFTSEQEEKLDTLLAETKLGLPPDFSKLLVFRGLKTELGSGEDKTDRAMLRRFLSHKELLDKILEPIKKSVRAAKIEGYKINADNRGVIKDREKLKQKLAKLKELFNQVETKYLGSELYELKEKAASLEEKEEKLLLAKRYRAYQLQQELEKLQAKVKQFKERDLSQLRSEIKTWQADVAEFKCIQAKLKKLEKKTKHYLWLKSALKQYQALRQVVTDDKPSLLWLSLALGALILAGGLLFINLKLVGLVLLAVAVGLAVRHHLLQNKYLATFSQNQDLTELKADFKKRFQEELTSLATLQAKQEKLTEAYHKLQTLEEMQVEKKQALSGQRLSLQTELKTLVGQKLEPKDWLTKLETLKQKQTQFETKLRNKDKALIKLRVEADQFVTTQPKIKYDPAREAQLKQEQQKIEQKISQQESAQKTLKQRLCDATDEDISTPWQDLITVLGDKYQALQNKFKQLTAQIIAQKQVTTVIQELLEAEDEKITQVLESDLIKTLLPQVTTHYQDLELKNDTLFVSDGFNSFPVHELSAGAKEQVFLTLRIALASQWFQQEKMFLILDDAFIHSDQTRKEALVKSMFKLAEAGWQLICLSFDERVKDLFGNHAPNYELLDLNEG